jgi:DNA-binding NtrC family response regulator
MEYILVVDDNENMQFILSNILQEKGYEVECVGNGLEAIKKVRDRVPDLVLLDIRLPGKNGLEVLKKLREMYKEIIVIMITAYGDVKSAVSTIKAGAYDYVTKPFDNEELIHTIKRALKTYKLNREVKILREKLTEQAEMNKVMGNSPEVKKILKQVELVSPTNISVIIQGKSGTGKEVIANMIHQKSNRADNPFIAVDCGAIPETLVESELLGYEKGAFTGADTHKKGEFELADGGTLFLDEISNLPLAAQAKLLRVLQERKLRRIGGSKTIEVDIRIVVATNLNLLDMVNEGNFREDLFHRLSEFKIVLPLLKERKDDLPVLAEEFLREANIELNKEIIGLSSESMRRLLDYDWPGNIRELKHTIRRAVLLCDNEYILPECLKFETNTNPCKSVDNIESSLQRIIKGDSTLSEIIAELNNDTEKNIIRKILEEVKYNKSKAAKVLGIDRNTLYAKIKNLNIE